MKIKISILIGIILSVLCLASCGDGDRKPTVQNGIVILPDPPITISAQLEKEAEDCIFELMKGYYEEAISVEPNSVVLEKLRAESRSIQALTEEYPLTEKQYAALIECIKTNSEAIVSAVTSPSPELSGLKELYREISNATDREYFGITAYKLLLYRYDYRYAEAMERYEQHKYPFLLEDAEKIAADKRILMDGVGEKGFANATKMFFFFSELLYSGAHEQGSMDAFTDEEILVLLNNIELSLDDVTPEGYELLLSYIPAAEDGEYLSRLLYTVRENGDASAVADRMGDLIRLIMLIRDNMTAEDCAFIRSSDHRSIIVSAMRRFDSDGWELFRKATEIQLNNSDLSQVAREEFGSAYDDFLSSVQIYSLEQLKSANDADALKALKGYIAGICPAIAYLIEL